MKESHRIHWAPILAQAWTTWLVGFASLSSPLLKEEYGLGWRLLGATTFAGLSILFGVMAALLSFDLRKNP